MFSATLLARSTPLLAPKAVRTVAQLKDGPLKPLAKLDVPQLAAALRAEGSGAAGNDVGIPLHLSAPFQQAAAAAAATPFPAHWMRRMDERQDCLQYESDRCGVHHADEASREFIRARYVASLGAAAAAAPAHRTLNTLDLCTSWTSHITDSDAQAARLSLAGVGMNEAEMQANPLLGAGRALRDLNLEVCERFAGQQAGGLALDSAAHMEPFVAGGAVHSALSEMLLAPAGWDRVDATLCSLSIDYLLNPVGVLQCAAELSQPSTAPPLDATLLVSFTNRCFAPKAVGLWLALSMSQRAAVVSAWATQAGWRNVEVWALDGGCAGGDPMVVVAAKGYI